MHLLVCNKGFIVHYARYGHNRTVLAVALYSTAVLYSDTYLKLYTYVAAAFAAKLHVRGEQNYVVALSVLTRRNAVGNT